MKEEGKKRDDEVSSQNDLGLTNVSEMEQFSPTSGIKAALGLLNRTEPPASSGHNKPDIITSTERVSEPLREAESISTENPSSEANSDSLWAKGDDSVVPGESASEAQAGTPPPPKPKTKKTSKKSRIGANFSKPIPK